MGKLLSVEDLTKIKKEASYRIVTLDEDSKAELRKAKKETALKNTEK